MELEDVYETEGRTRFDRILAVLIGVAAVLASLLVNLQAHADREAGRASANASRLAAEAFEAVSGFGIVGSFQLGTRLQATEIALRATARQAAAFEHPEAQAVQSAIGAAADAAAQRILELTNEMTELPGPESGLDPHVVGVLHRGVEELQALVARQGEQVDRAQRFGARSDRVVFALSMLAIGGVLLGLAGIMKETPNGRISLWAAAAMLVLSTLWGGSALLL